MNINASDGLSLQDRWVAASGGAVPTSGADVGRKALWAIRELGLPAIVKTCLSCRSDHHHPSGKFRVNANGKLLDVWLLMHCDRCGRTSKIPIHERISVRELENSRLMMFENNDPATVRELVLDASLASKAMYRLDWTDTWTLETHEPFYTLDDPEPINIIVSFELPASIRLERILMLGFGVSRSQLRSVVASGRVLLPVDLDSKVRDDFTLTVTGTESAGDILDGQGKITTFRYDADAN